MTENDYFTRTGSKLVRLLRKHFPISGQSEDLKIDDSIRPEFIESFYTEYIATVRPIKLRTENIFPAPNPSILRALYLGSPSANSFLNNLVRHSLYVDQILITDPFQSIVMLDSPANVRDDPGIWMDVIVNRAIAIMAISEWIENDIVRVMPNPFYYYRDVLFESADQLEAKGVSIPSDFQEQVEEDVIIELLLSQEESAWDDLLLSLKSLGRPSTKERRDYLKSRAREYERQYPIRFRASNEIMEKYSFSQGFPSKMISWGGGTPIHLAPDVASLTGSFLLFEKKASYNLFRSNYERASPNEYQEISQAFQDLSFPFLHNVPISVALEGHKEGYLRKFRSYLRDTWISIRTEDSKENIQTQSLAFQDRLSSEYSDLQSEWKRIQKELRLGAINHGMLLGTSAVVAGALNWTLGVAGILGSIADSIREYRDLASKFDIAKQNPLAIFVDLERKQK